MGSRKKVCSRSKHACACAHWGIIVSNPEVGVVTSAKRASAVKACAVSRLDVPVILALIAYTINVTTGAQTDGRVATIERVQMNSKNTVANLISETLRLWTKSEAALVRPQQYVSDLAL